jgi:hypothetical protein
MSDQEIHVSCEARGEAWRCVVTVGDDPHCTEHEVGVTAIDVARIAPPGTPVETAVEAAFAYLLDHEPRESILRSFDLPVIGRYFPGFEAEVRRRLARR